MTHEYMLRLRDGRLLFGYYDNDERARAAISIYADTLTGAWKSLNPIRPDSALLAALNAPLHRSAHRAGIADIDRRAGLLLDFDAACPSDVMSNDAEHVAAIALAGECSDWLVSSFGWPRPSRNDSGRGCQLLPEIELPTDTDTDALVKNLLRALKTRYPLIDAGMSDRPRLARLPGFWNRKSESETTDRPWRMAQVLDAGDVGALVTRQQIEAVISAIGLHAIPQYHRGEEKPDPENVQRAIHKIAEWLDQIGVTLTEIVPLADGRILLRLNHCPLFPLHRASSAGIGISVGGRPQNFCRHTSCAMPWSEWRAAAEKKTGVPLRLGRRLIFGKREMN